MRLEVIFLTINIEERLTRKQNYAFFAIVIVEGNFCTSAKLGIPGYESAGPQFGGDQRDGACAEEPRGVSPEAIN